jgi:hypothetical protein
MVIRFSGGRVLFFCFFGSFIQCFGFHYLFLASNGTAATQVALVLTYHFQLKSSRRGEEEDSKHT